MQYNLPAGNVTNDNERYSNIVLSFPPNAAASPIIKRESYTRYIIGKPAKLHISQKQRDSGIFSLKYCTNISHYILILTRTLTHLTTSQYHTGAARGRWPNFVLLWFLWHVMLRVTLLCFTFKRVSIFMALAKTVIAFFIGGFYLKVHRAKRKRCFDRLKKKKLTSIFKSFDALLLLSFCCQLSLISNVFFLYSRSYKTEHAMKD